MQWGGITLHIWRKVEGEGRFEEGGGRKTGCGKKGGKIVYYKHSTPHTT